LRVAGAVCGTGSHFGAAAQVEGQKVIGLFFSDGQKLGLITYLYRR